MISHSYYQWLIREDRQDVPAPGPVFGGSSELPMWFLPPASEGWGKVLFSVCLSVHTSTGGGVPGLKFSAGGTRSQISGGGTQSQIFGGGVPGLRKGKNF